MTVALPELHPFDVSRFFRLCERKPNGCLEWKVWHVSDKPQFNIQGRAYRASRVAWLIATGEDPGELCVLHKCDNTHCVDFEHLFLGTQADNMADMHAKNRFVPTFCVVGCTCGRHRKV